MIEESPDKSHQTAVVWIPPAAKAEPIQRIRMKYDKKVDRWMAHINLLYPFRPPEALAEASALVAAACANVAPFEVSFADFREFSHGRDRHTIWLVPEPAEPFIRLQAALEEKFPDCSDVASFEGGFVPHLSVGQAVGQGAVGFRMHEIRAGWTPQAFRVEEIALIVRDDEGPFRVERTFPLGQAAAGPPA